MGLELLLQKKNNTKTTVTKDLIILPSLLVYFKYLKVKTCKFCFFDKIIEESVTHFMLFWFSTFSRPVQRTLNNSNQWKGIVKSAPIKFQTGF